MTRINEDSCIIIRELRNYIGIYEHDFISVGTKQESSIICITCGLVYCEKCGKLVTLREKNYMQHIISITRESISGNIVSILDRPLKGRLTNLLQLIT